MNDETPQRCGQRHIQTATGTEYTCTLAADHRSEFHRSDDGATWSHAGDLTVPSLQHDTCGARLTVSPAPGEDDPRMLTWTCALSPHDFNTRHVASDGTQWRATDFPPTALQARGDFAVTMRALHDASAEITKLRAAILRSGECICPTVLASPPDGADREDDPLCPQHGTVAELVRQLTWASSFTARIIAALGAPWTEPFHGGDVAEEAARRIRIGEDVHNVNIALRNAGIDYPTGARGVTDLAGQRDAHREHADNAERALSRIADMARQALGPDGHGQLSVALGRIIAVTEEKDR